MLVGETEMEDEDPWYFKLAKRVGDQQQGWLERIM